MMTMQRSEDIGVGLTMTLTSEVTEAAEAGSTVEMTVDAIDGRISGRGEDEILAEMEPLIGKALVIEYDENGNQVGTTTLKDGSDLPESLADSFETATATSFPSEAIGIGSRWSSVTTSNSGGFELEVTTVYELTDITEDELIIEVTQDLPVDQESMDRRCRGHSTAPVNCALPATIRSCWTCSTTSRRLLVRPGRQQRRGGRDDQHGRRRPIRVRRPVPDRR